MGNLMGGIWKDKSGKRLRGGGGAGAELEDAGGILLLPTGGTFLTRPTE